MGLDGGPVAVLSPMLGLPLAKLVRGRRARLSALHRQVSTLAVSRGEVTITMGSCVCVWGGGGGGGLVKPKQ